MFHVALKEFLAGELLESVIYYRWMNEGKI